MTSEQTILVTGATSGLGYATARTLAREGWGTVLVSGRTLAKANAAIARLLEEVPTGVFEPVAVDLSKPDSVEAAVKALTARAGELDVLILNAGLVSGSEPVRNAAGIERTFAASVIGHHQLVVGLLNRGKLAADARIVLSGSEAARNDVPMMTVADVPAFAAAHTGGDRVAAIEKLAKVSPEWSWNNNDAYATTKALSAWWTAALARRLPEGMRVNAVSPGSRPQTEAARNNGLSGALIMWMMRWVGPFFSMAGPLEDGVQRYLDTAKRQANGKFYASPAGKLVGPLQEQLQPHIVDRGTQEAAWRAVVNLSGVALAEPLRAVG